MDFITALEHLKDKKHNEILSDWEIYIEDNY